MIDDERGTVSGMADGPLPPAQARTLVEALHVWHPVVDDPHWVPPSRRVETDADDPDSVANPDGEDWSDIDPDAGDIVDLTAIPSA